MLDIVHVEAGEVVVAQRAQYPHPTDSQHGLLAEPIPRVAAIEMVSQLPVSLGVFRQITVQQIDRDGESADAFDQGESAPTI